MKEQSRVRNYILSERIKELRSDFIVLNSDRLRQIANHPEFKLGMKKFRKVCEEVFRMLGMIASGLVLVFLLCKIS